MWVVQEGRGDAAGPVAGGHHDDQCPGHLRHRPHPAADIGHDLPGDELVAAHTRQRPDRRAGVDHHHGLDDDHDRGAEDDRAADRCPHRPAEADHHAADHDAADHAHDQAGADDHSTDDDHGGADDGGADHIPTAGDHGATDERPSDDDDVDLEHLDLEHLDLEHLDDVHHGPELDDIVDFDHHPHRADDFDHPRPRIHPHGGRKHLHRADHPGDEDL
jgi:hypothetical protein